MLDTLNSLLSCLRGDDTDVQTLIDVELERMTQAELELYYIEGEHSFYIAYPQCFKDAYYLEFIEA